MKKDHFNLLKMRKVKIPAIATMVIIFIFFYWNPTLDYEWLFGSIPYSQLENIATFPWLERLFVYLVSLIAVFSFWSLVPQKQYFFTKIGKYTLYVYLLHGFVIKYLRETDLDKWFNENYQIILLVIGSLLLTFLLSSKFVRGLSQPIIELRAVYWRNILKQFNRKLFS
jgi:fucose 4-O-acetylase-like acetyltransferase